MKKKLTPMEKKWDQLNKYFIDKLITENYVLVSINEHIATILIDEKYQFTIWRANAFGFIGCYYNGKNAMELTFREDAKLMLFNRFKKNYDYVLSRPEEVEKRKEEYLKLKKEFEPIETQAS
jgi:hypothetical protein